jgi:23S rRNA pseudouridine1911/1915/1917 synthase
MSLSLHNGAMPEWTAETAERLDAFLGKEGRMLSRAKAQKAIEDGSVSVNGKKEKKSSRKVKPGDVVRSEEQEKEILEKIKPTDLKLEILYEDDACFVITKPAGIAVHPGAGMSKEETTLLHGAAFLYKKRKLRFTPDSVLVHRLDKETTGCILIAKNAKAHLALQKQFETRTVRKIYLALVAGVPALKTAKIDAPIGRSLGDRTKMSIRSMSSVREAQTTYRVITSSAEASLLECDLHTGRTHQVRVHLESIEHPVLGDSSYQSNVSRKIALQYGIDSLCLHAWQLRFVSPDDGKEHHITAPLPKPFLAAVQKLGIEWKE